MNIGKRIIFYIFCFAACHSLLGQKYSRLQAAFSIIEKNTLTDSSFIVIGTVDYDLFSDISKYSITFPTETTWIFQDSTITSYDAEMNITDIDTVGTAFNEYTVFRKILLDELTDFGLVEAGFEISEVEKVDESIIYQWIPPEGQFDFIKYIVTEQVEEKLTGLIIIDENDKSINETYYEDYHLVNDLSIPQKIKLHFTGEEEEIFKTISFRDVKIQ